MKIQTSVVDKISEEWRHVGPNPGSTFANLGLLASQWLKTPNVLNLQRERSRYRTYKIQNQVQACHGYWGVIKSWMVWLFTVAPMTVYMLQI